MDDEDDPFSFITRQSYCSPSQEQLLKRLPYAREQEFHSIIDSPAPSRLPPPAAAVNGADFVLIKAAKNQSPRVPPPVQAPSPNRRFRASTTEVGESSKKKKFEIPKDAKIISLEDSDREGQRKGKGKGKDVQEAEIAEDAGANSRRLLPMWARMNQEAQNLLDIQKSKQRGDDMVSTKKRGYDVITLISVLNALDREEKEDRLKLGLDDGTAGDFLETAMRRGVTFTKSK